MRTGNGGYELWLLDPKFSHGSTVRRLIRTMDHIILDGGGNGAMEDWKRTYLVDKNYRYLVKEIFDESPPNAITREQLLLELETV